MLSAFILAAVLLTWLPEQLRSLASLHVEEYRLVLYSLMLIVMMLVRPQGLLGRRELWWKPKRLRRAPQNVSAIAPEK